MRWLLALLVGLLVCCSPRVVAQEAHTGAPVVATVVLHGDLEFTPPERAAINAATERLAYATAGAVRVQVVWDLDYRTLTGQETNVLMRVESWYPFVQAATPPGVAILGVTHPPTHTIFLVVDAVAERDIPLDAVALHELLHLLGLPHLDVPGALMRPAYSGKKCLSAVDLAALCQTLRCDPALTNPC